MRTWRDYGVAPCRSETFKFSTDPELVAKVIDVVGLDLAPGERYRIRDHHDRTGQWRRARAKEHADKRTMTSARQPKRHVMPGFDDIKKLADEHHEQVDQGLEKAGGSAAAKARPRRADPLPLGDAPVAGRGKRVGEVAKFAVRSLRGDDEQVEGFDGADLVSLHQDSFGLADDVARI